MNLAGKLQLKRGVPLFVFNPPDGMIEHLQSELAENLISKTVTQPAAEFLLFVNHMADFNNWLPRVLEVANPDTLFLVAYPKGSSGIKTDVNRDNLAVAAFEDGWQAIRNVALDETWSVLRYRPLDKIGR